MACKSGKEVAAVENTKNLCAQIPETLHARVRAEQEQSGQTLSQYVTALITEYYNQKEGKKMDGNRTMAFQISEELFQRIKRYLDSESERSGRKISQREFVLGLIQQALDEANIV
ncbi:MAG: translation initiation factor 2 [Proteiniphilum sp.]|nr:translation initiation factor 2 [Proteiniphilum sp.]